MSAPAPDASYEDKIKWITETQQDITKYITKETDTEALEKDTAALDVKDKESSPQEQIRKDFLYIGGPEVLLRKTTREPEQTKSTEINPENARITDKVAKESSDSNASTHELHNEDHSGATSGGNVSANAHKANPGPVHADNLPTPESKEDLKKRAEELNK